MTFTSEFLKRQKTLWKVNFWCQWIIHLIIWYNKGSYCEQNRWCKYIFIWVCLSTGPWVCCVFVCVISNVFNQDCMCQNLSKLDALLHKTHIKVLLVQSLDMCRSILSLSKIAHQIALLILKRPKSRYCPILKRPA